MTTHCKLGDTDIFVVYTLGNSKPKIIKIKNAPIEIETRTIVRSIPFSEQVEGQLYNVNYTLDRTGYIDEPTTGTEVFTGLITGAYVRADDAVGFNEGNRWQQVAYIIAQGRSNKVYDQPTDITISNFFTPRKGAITINWIAPLYNQESRCTLEIYHKSGRIYYDEGDCPCSYEVTCEQLCPPGTLKCFSTNYPGYCCLPCPPVAASVKDIANTVRQLNKKEVSRG